MTRVLTVLTVLAVLAAMLAGWAGLRARPRPVPEAHVANRPNQIPEDGYAGSAACRACHPREYATWHASYHRTMTQVATPETVRADFDGTTIADVHGAPMQLARRGDRFFATFDDPFDFASNVGSAQGRPLDFASNVGSARGTALESGGADSNASQRAAVGLPPSRDRASGSTPPPPSSAQPPPRIEREVAMITGSHHQQIYWYATGRHRLLGQLPGAYLIEEARWIPRRLAVLHPPQDPVFSETGHWNSTCIACHTTQGKPEFDTPFGSRPIGEQVVNSRTVEHGISCEACHGPAAEHVRANGNPLRRYRMHFSAAPERTAVQPQRLDPRRSSQVCGQCHGIWEFPDAASERYANSRGLPYRPGDELTATRFVAQPTRNRTSAAMQALLSVDAGFLRDSFWDDGKVRVSGREYNGLIESPCFTMATEPARTLTCFSCHAMHKAPGGADDPRPTAEWANDQLAPGMDGDRACTQCHTGIEKNVPAHTRHSADSSGSRCYNCHMPYTTYGLLKTIRSHTVSSPSAQESVETGRPNACNLCHLDQTLRWTSDTLHEWYGTPAAPVPADLETTSAALVWAARGDAGQRAIVAQAMGWPAAKQASGTAWLIPVLAQLLDDPYDAVRFIAGRSFRTLPPAASGFQYDFIAGAGQRRDAQRRAMALWDRVKGSVPPSARRRVLLDERGELRVDELLRLIRARDDRRVLLRE